MNLYEDEALLEAELSVILAADSVWGVHNPLGERSRTLWFDIQRIKNSKALTETPSWAAAAPPGQRSGVPSGAVIGPTPLTVRSVIPESKLAQYCDSPYHADREASYLPDCPVPDLQICSAEYPWTHPDVEAVVRKLKIASKPKLVHAVQIDPFLKSKNPALAKACQPYYHGDGTGDDADVYELPNQILPLRDEKELEILRRTKACQQLWTQAFPNLFPASRSSKHSRSASKKNPLVKSAKSS